MYLPHNIEQRSSFFGIQKSVTGKIWLERLDAMGINNALSITQKYGFHDLLARILSARGVDQTQAESFINPKLRDLMPDPFLFADMEKAITRIAKACLDKEQVVIWGDYDVDGACSSAILSRFLTSQGVNNRIYIPDRVLEGYGLNSKGIHTLISEGATLILTVDCGANNVEDITIANSAGVDVIVLDHHQVTMDTLKRMSWIQVNPNRPDDISMQRHLCAAGVVFVTIAALSRLLYKMNGHPIPDLLGFLDLVALATVCDIVPLIGVNRAFIIAGLQIARRMNNPGLSALARVACIGSPLNVFHLGYIIGPRINAGGRIGDPSLGARLLTSDDEEEVKILADTLNILNSKRQEMEKQQLLDAEIQAEIVFSSKSYVPVLIVANRNWHPGVIGLIAARLKDKFNRPTIAIAVDENGLGVGSARSIHGIDIGSLITEAAEENILEKGGGHAMAAGLTIKEEKIKRLCLWLSEKIVQKYNEEERCLTLQIDGTLSASGITISLIENLEKAGPYGPGHETPIFVFPSHKITYFREIGERHISISLIDINGKRLKGIAFNVKGKPLGNFLIKSHKQHIHLAGNMTLNYWNGMITPQLIIVDAAKVSS